MKAVPNNKLVQYVINNCSRELQEIKNRNIGDVNNLLSIEEHTLIYKYTEGGYEGLNERLRVSEGKDLSEFGKLLDQTLAKLPDYEDITYRTTDLTPGELEKYITCNQNSSILVEHSFISTSKSKFIAYEFGRNCQFMIIGKSGKEIEKFAKYGEHHPQNEREVLFRPNIIFKVLEITKSDNYTLITLEEK